MEKKKKKCGVQVPTSDLPKIPKVLFKLKLTTTFGSWTLSMNIQDWNQDWLVWSPCSPRDSEESFPTPEFKSISSSALSCLYSPTLTYIHDYWKNHKSHERVQILWFSFHKDKKTQDSRLPLVLVKELHVPIGCAGVPHWGLRPKPQRINAHSFIHSLLSAYSGSGTEGKSDKVG